MAKKLKYYDCIPNAQWMGFGVLNYQNHCKPFMVEKETWSESQKQQINAILQLEGDEIDETLMKEMDCVDIVNTETCDIIFQLYLYPYGSRAIYLNGTTTLFAEILQHGYEFVIQPKTDKERILAYRLLIDLASADETSPYQLIDSIGCSSSDYLSDLYHKDIDVTILPDYIKYEKECDKRGFPLRPLRRDGKVILKLTNRNLKEFPAKVFEIPDLTHLDLRGNQITVIPPEIEKLKNLKSFILNGNKLETLPKEIGKLTQLEEFDLCGTPLKSFPDEVSTLKKLQSINFSYTFFETFPKNISKIPDLKNLSLISAKLTELSSEIFEMTSLTAG